MGVPHSKTCRRPLPSRKRNNSQSAQLIAYLCAMKLCRFQTPKKEIRVGLCIDEDKVLDISAAGFASLYSVFEASAVQLAALAKEKLPQYALGDVRLLTPVER